jgi:hypothetical protein
MLLISLIIEFNIKIADFKTQSKMKPV